MDDRAYQPYLPDDPPSPTRRRPRATSAHRFTGASATRPPTTSSFSGRSTPRPGTGATTPRCSSSSGAAARCCSTSRCPARSSGRHAGRGRSDGHPGRAPVVATANDKAVEMLGPARSVRRRPWSRSARTSRRWCTDTRTTRAPHVLDELRCIPNRYLYESNGVRRGMWTLTWFLDLLGAEVAERAASLGVSREE